MADVDKQGSNNLKRCSGISLTLPKEYRPKYRTNDTLLQSSSEQMPLNLDHPVNILTPPRHRVAESRGLPNQPITHPASPATVPTTPTTPRWVPPAASPCTPPAQWLPPAPYSSATAPWWHSPDVSWTYSPSHTAAYPEAFHTVPRHRGHPSRWRGGMASGSPRGPNAFYVGIVTIPPTNFKSSLPLRTDVDKGRSRLLSPKSPLNFFIPTIVQSSGLNAYHLDGETHTCTTWRGLSSTDAEELFMWTNLHDAILQQRRECGHPSLELSDIAVEMVKRFVQRPPIGHSWFVSAPNIYQRVERLLTITTETPSLQIKELKMPVVGQQYALAPRLVNLPDSPHSRFSRDIFFSTTVDWLTFDSSSNLFTGILPSAPQKIYIKARVIEYLDERVRLEHVVRSSVTPRATRNYMDRLSNLIMDTRNVKGTPKDSKKVSFADEHGTDSLHSSPDHLISFFNELASLTHAPMENSLSNGIPVKTGAAAQTMYAYDASTPSADTLSGLEAVIEEARASNHDLSSSGLGPDTIEGSGAPVSACPDRSEPLRAPSCSPSCDGSESNTKMVLAPSADDQVPWNTVARTGVYNSCTGITPCNNDDEAHGKRDRSSFLDDPDGDHNHGVALGLSSPGLDSVNDLPEPTNPTSHVFRNGPNSFSNCSKLGRPQKACRLSASKELVSQHDDTRAQTRVAFISDERRMHDKYGSVVCLEDVIRDLDRFSWKGWEQETAMRKLRISL